MLNKPPIPPVAIKDKTSKTTSTTLATIATLMTTTNNGGHRTKVNNMCKKISSLKATIYLSLPLLLLLFFNNLYRDGSNLGTS
jgi:hypothetical protein